MMQSKNVQAEQAVASVLTAEGAHLLGLTAETLMVAASLAVLLVAVVRLGA